MSSGISRIFIGLPKMSSGILRLIREVLRIYSGILRLGNYEILWITIS